MSKLSSIWFLMLLQHCKCLRNETSWLYLLSWSRNHWSWNNFASQVIIYNTKKWYPYLIVSSSPFFLTCNFAFWFQTCAVWLLRCLPILIESTWWTKWSQPTLLIFTFYFGLKPPAYGATTNALRLGGSDGKDSNLVSHQFAIIKCGIA